MLNSVQADHSALSDPSHNILTRNQRRHPPPPACPFREVCPLSVLVEAFTLVIRRPSLERTYPGGVEAFLHYLSKLPNPPRFACNSDPLLVNVSFEHIDHLIEVTDHLEANSLLEEADGEAADYVYLDQREGPVLPCSWLTWERFTETVTVAWVAGAEPGALAAPADWVPSDAPPVSDGEPNILDRFLPLATGNGSEILLDLETGSEVERSVPVPPFPDESEDEMSLHSAVLAAIAAAGWTAHQAVAPVVVVELVGMHAIYTCRYYVPAELRVVVCCTRAPLVVPEAARRKVTEFITRANYGLLLGGFEMSLEQGSLFFRASCQVEDGELTTQMACTLANVGVWAFDRYYPHLLEVVYGKRSVADAVQRAER